MKGFRKRSLFRRVVKGIKEGAKEERAQTNWVREKSMKRKVIQGIRSVKKWRLWAA